MEFRRAVKDDLPEIIRLLADDELGKLREKAEDPLPEAYYQAFAAMEAQTGNFIILAVEGDAILGCVQLLILPGLSRLGMNRAQIEGVRVNKNYRGRKIGEKLMKESLRIAKEENCGLVQLTTDKSRTDALRFYERLGFVASHEGMKLNL